MLLRTLTFTVLSAVFAAPASANPDAAPAEQLQDVRAAISAADADLRQKQAARQQAEQTLDRSRAALDKARRELDTVTRRQRDAWQKLQTLQNGLESLKTEAAAAKAQVARLLGSQYKNRQPHAVVLFLKNAESGQKTRYLEYARRISQANSRMIADLAGQQKKLEEREAAIDAELARLNRLKTQKQNALGRLSRNSSEAQAESRKLTAQIGSQAKRITALRADEARLNRVLADIARRHAQQRRQEAQARAKAAQERLAAEKARQARNRTQPAPAKPEPKTKQTAAVPKTSPATPKSTLTAEDRALQAPYENNSGFARLQGRLNRPSGGSMTGRFGSPRPGGGSWRGLFFSTGAAAVHSVAAGTVAYTGSLGGYGNTVIVDHGGGYTSVYAGLSAISVGSGSSVSAGSSLGSSGSLPDAGSGLYFAISYKGTPINPASWLR
ncbi:peptidoglycan DD-metalloendopeptidase family protein [Neisseria leonii]|uniref:Peptidoglycan DD-metalloendopeptidase family protein n=1 Tax=Neisseria leonii TaxID=2995413 RepID=A0A9X4E3C2_9NEIS|nr:peptidoglycan DD-metalloendopeptidase family protein [Neisseria sp. 51.81]MDD9326912.1 peptidoglycan DD-metalloendopeptidase family protein [Neisseria sp. 51.81]